MKELIHGHKYQEAGVIGSHLSFVILGHYLHVNLHLLGLKIGKYLEHTNEIIFAYHVTGGSAQPCKITET